MKIGPVELPSPYAIAPMAGMTDTAFRRLVKRRGGCGLVVTEMVSSEGLVRGIDRTLEYAEVMAHEGGRQAQVLGDAAARQLRTLDGQRSITASGGSFTDSFGPLEVRVYIASPVQG